MRTRLVVGGLAVAGLLAAGCSTGLNGGAAQPGTAAGSPISGAGAAGPAGGKLARLITFARCMRTHGVPGFPDPIAISNGKPVFAASSGRGVNQNSPQFSRADRECNSLLDGQGQGEQAITARDQVDYLRAAQCMRAHGITGFPDPVFAGGGVNFPVPASIDTHSAQVVRAIAICRRLIPVGLPYGR